MSVHLTESEQRLLLKMDLILKEIRDLKEEINNLKGIPKPTRIPMGDFCKERNISRPTAYSWHERGIIQLEKVGGRQYVNVNSITIPHKPYQRNGKLG